LTDWDSQAVKYLACRAKNFPRLQAANNSRSSEKLSVKFEVLTGKTLAWRTSDQAFLLNEKYFNWKFVAEYGTSYFIILPNNTRQKSFVISFVFIPFLKNNFISAMRSLKCRIEFVNTPYQRHYSGYVLTYSFYAGVMQDREGPFSLNYACLKNY